MKKHTILVLAVMFITSIGITHPSYAQHNHTMPHEMQHGFILASGDKFASHLVATGHHSRQTEILGELSISDVGEKELYEERKLSSAGTSFFLFQAQSLDLPSLREGQVLVGHIIESKVGSYDPQNTIVKKATYKVEKILLNIENPFFKE